MRHILLSLKLILICCFGIKLYSAEAQSYFQTSFDRIPNFAQIPTIVSAQSGNWSNAGSWNPAHVPNASDIVLISNQHSITFDAPSGIASVVGIRDGGRLRFHTSLQTELKVGTLFVMPQGILEVGTSDAPITGSATITFRDMPLQTGTAGAPGIDPQQWGTGLIALDGKVHMYGRQFSNTFVQLSAEAQAGSSNILLKDGVSDWRVGDRIFIPDTRYSRWALPDIQHEFRNIAAISDDGKTVTLDQPLIHLHEAGRNCDDQVTEFPHLANFSRNILLRSENPQGVRGHAAFINRTDMDIRYARFLDLGRTKLNPLDNTKFDASGSIVSIGTNQMGRYPVHVHHLHGPATPGSDGFQSRLIGSVIERSTKWAWTVHGSSYHLGRDNIVYDVLGTAIMDEDGQHTALTLDHNFVANVVGTGSRADERAGTGEYGIDGSAFWIENPHRLSLTNNVVAGARTATAYMFFPKFGQQKIPSFQGADPTVAGQFQLVEESLIAPDRVQNNTAYATFRGVEVWNWGAGTSNLIPNGSPILFKDFKVWNTIQGFYGYPAGKITFDGFKVYGKKSSLTNPNDAPSGYQAGDYLQYDTKMINSELCNLGAGVMVSAKVGASNSSGSAVMTGIHIKDSRFKNVANVMASTQWGVTGGGTGLTKRETIIDNVKFEGPDNVPASWVKNISLTYMECGTNTNPLVDDWVTVKNYNQVPGSNFKVYYYEQHPDYIVPGPDSCAGVTAPVSGLTNQQSSAQFGLAIAGRVTPCTDVADKIDGFVCMDGAGPRPPAPTVNQIYNVSNSLRRTGSGLELTRKFLTTQLSKGMLKAQQNQFPMQSESQFSLAHVFSVAVPAGQQILNQIGATDQQGVSIWNDYLYTNTPEIDPAKDSQAPGISDIYVSRVTATSASILFRTSELATSTVQYGTTTSYGSSVSGRDILIVDHGITLSGLSPQTTYHAKIIAKDAAGNQKASQDLTFTTGFAEGPMYMEILSPVPDLNTGASSVLVAYQVKGHITDFAQVQAVVNGVSHSFNPNQTGTFTLPLSPGENLIDIKVLGPGFTYNYVSAGIRVFRVSGSGTNAAPTVNVGADRSVALPSTLTLRATLTDDGLPFPPGGLSLTWSQRSGPAPVQFSDVTSATTNVTFQAPGIYVISMTANDGAASTTDDLTVIVTAAAKRPKAPTGLRVMQ